jgi:hypothetical protein
MTNVWLGELREGLALRRFFLKVVQRNAPVKEEKLSRWGSAKKAYFRELTSQREILSWYSKLPRKC